MDPYADLPPPKAPTPPPAPTAPTAAAAPAKRSILKGPADRAEAAPTPSPSAAPPPASEPRKRARVLTVSEARAEAVATSTSATEEAKLQALLDKLARFVVVQPKCAKALNLLARAVEASLSADTAAQFFPVLALTQEHPDWVATDWGRAPFKALFKLVASRQGEGLEGSGGEPGLDAAQRFRVGSWVLRCVSVPELVTDDTYQFARAARAVMAATRAWDSPPSPDEVPASAVAERHDVVIECLSTMLALAHHRWAKTPIETAFKEATDRRPLLAPPQQARLDAAFASLRADRSRREVAIGKSSLHRSQRFNTYSA